MQIHHEIIWCDWFANVSIYILGILWKDWSKNKKEIQLSKHAIFSMSLAKNSSVLLLLKLSFYSKPLNSAHFSTLCNLVHMLINLFSNSPVFSSTTNLKTPHSPWFLLGRREQLSGQWDQSHHKSCFTHLLVGPALSLAK